MAIYENTKCDLCGYIIQNQAADKCPNCDADINHPVIDVKLMKARDKSAAKRFELRLTAVDDGEGGERLGALSEPWAKLGLLAVALDEARHPSHCEIHRGRVDVQNTLDMLTAGALSMAGQNDPKCSVVNHFIRAIGKHLAVTLGELQSLERFIRETAPHFPSWRSGETLAESIGQTMDGLQAIREGFSTSCGDSLDDLPKWEVNVQPTKPKHAIPKSVCVQAPDPLTARMVALNVARERWPGKDFTAISAVPHLDEAEF